MCFTDSAAGTFLNKGLDPGIPFTCRHGERVIRCHCHKGSAEDRIRARCENPQRLAPCCQGKVDLDAVGTADPVALHGLHRIRPARHPVQFLKQLIGVSRDPNEPLRNFPFLNHRAGAPPLAIDHLLVGQHGLVNRVPIDHGVLAVSESFFHQPGKKPLLPAVILRLAGRYLARPVIRETHTLQLSAHMVDVLIGPLCGRDRSLDRRVLGRQPERIPAHGLQDIAPQHPLIATHHIADRVVTDMSHVQLTRGIRQHGQAVELFPRRVFSNLEALLLFPVRLHNRFELLRGIARVHEMFRLGSLLREREKGIDQ